MVLQVSQLDYAPVVTWEKLPDDFILPNDPVDNIHQPFLAAALTEALYLVGKVSETVLASTNYGVCATIDGKIVVKAPDWAYIPDIKVERSEVFRSYTPVLQGDKPIVVMEFLSDTDGGEYSIKPTYPPGKWYFYEQILRVPHYVIFDPLSGDLEIYHLNEAGRYQLQIMNNAGHYDIPEMQLSLGTWQGEREGRSGYWLRWWDASGNLLLWGFEKAEQERQRAEQEKQRAEQEKQRADALAEKLRELGIEPNDL
jgi:Putative restriction endonuclease